MANYFGSLSIRLKDFMGVKAPHLVYFQVADSHTVADLVTATADYCALLDPLTDAMGVSVQLKLDMPTTNLKSSVSVNNRLSNAGLFTFQQANIGNAYSIVIPAFAEAQIANGKVILTTGDPADLWIGGIKANPAVLLKESNVRNALPTFLSCKLPDRKHRKAQSLASNEV